MIPCQQCEAPSARRCSGCKTPGAWYCSTECQRKDWARHIFDCNPKKPINTAYHLARAAFDDCFPDDPQTCEDYGLAKAFLPENKSMLMGLYTGLISYMDVEPKTIHRWRLQGTLVEEIKLAYEKLPKDNRGGYYPWFLQNQWVLDRELRPPIGPCHEMMLRGWRYAVSSISSPTQEEIKVARAGWPEYKQECFFFCTSLLSSWHPSPELSNWLTFGFCVCEDEHRETTLAELYKQLVAKCSFDEICSAYQSSAFIKLFDAKGLGRERQSIPHLDDVLAGSPKMYKSVWRLKQFVITEDKPIVPSIGVDYGFFNCNGAAERLELKEVYKRFFAHRDGDPIELHEAAIGGRLFEYVGKFLKLKKKFRRLMKNVYPLRDPDA